tara:strand:- start:29 stop:220 length:192 start_codon:yes stop_codon:yes gene_type:complete
MDTMGNSETKIKKSKGAWIAHTEVYKRLTVIEDNQKKRTLSFLELSSGYLTQNQNQENLKTFV